MQSCVRKCHHLPLHMSAYVSIRRHTAAGHATHAAARTLTPPPSPAPPLLAHRHTSAYVGIRQHTSAYVSIPAPPLRARQHTSAYVSIRQHTSAYASIRQRGVSHRRSTRCPYFCTGKASKLSTCSSTTNTPASSARIPPPPSSLNALPSALRMRQHT